MSTITTHILDSALGKPAAGVPVRLEHLGPETRVLAEGKTDDDGRIRDLGPEGLEAGHYRLTFDIESYSAATRQTYFYPTVSITFIVAGEPGEHYHVPLLMSPFAYSTYRGS
ncbi:hydroxyisourate hydrolase [Nocardia tengchongensis]|uniref:hydroxyisourate hydrolase n=1 Tax=Nocardia tengchongensis TaxID=2055889 RepID=UPI0036088F51